MPTGTPTAKPVTGTPIAPAPAPAVPSPAKYCADTCPTARERKSWNFLTPAERALYIQAVQTLYSSGIYTKFVMIHQDGVNDPFAHGTSGFLPWHRKFLLEYENALRCLDVKFQCVTIPLWDWSEWQYYCNMQGGCGSYNELPAALKHENPNAESLLAAFGGPGTKGASGTPYGETGQKDGVGCVTKGPFAGWKDWEGNCLTPGRGVNWSLRDSANGPLTDRMTLITITTGQDAYGLDRGYRAGIQDTPHNMAHNYLGGHMRSMRSPMDPIFFSHHAFVDKNWATWQDCKDFEERTAARVDDRMYEGADKVKPGKGEKRISDNVDAPMPFKITLAAFTPLAAQCSEAAGPASTCRKCLAKLRPQDDWCSKRWHPSCDMLCAAEECRAVCGTGGSANEIDTVTDFKRTDGVPFPYVFDFHKYGQTPRDWSVGTTKLAQPFTYMVDQFDKDIAKTACNMQFPKNQRLELVQVLDSDKELFGDISFWKKFSQSTITKTKESFEQDMKAIEKTTDGNNKATVQIAVTKRMQEQCVKRDASSMCQGEFGLSGKCRWVCQGPVEDQPDVCGFQAAWNFKLADDSAVVSDMCKDLKEEGVTTKAPVTAASGFFTSSFWGFGR